MRIGTICYCTRQGIGWLPKWFYDQGIITDPVLYRHSRQNHTEWYPPDTPIVAVRNLADCEEVKAMVDRVDALLFFETPFDWNVIRLAHQHGKRTYIVPMYECTPRHIPVQPTKWLCPSLLDQRDYFPQSPYLPIPVPPGIKWQQRTEAKRFLHNGGHLGLRGHKGTLEILKAMQYVKSPIEITFTSQDVPGFDRILKECMKLSKGGATVRYDISEKPWKELYTDHDVFIMAEKYNGLSLPLAEARASGMLVMTSDRYPMNQWLPSWPLIRVDRTERACISPAYMEYAEAIVRPEDIAAKIDALYGRDITNYSLQGRLYGQENSWERLKPYWLEALSC